MTRLDTKTTAPGRTPGPKPAQPARFNGRALQAHRRPDTPPSRAGYRKPESERPESPEGLWDIASWCRAAKCSKTKLYKLWDQGAGPRKVQLGCSVRILESPLKYAERLAKEQAQEAQR